MHGGRITMRSSASCCARAGHNSMCMGVQGDEVEIYIMTKDGTAREVMPLKKD